MKLQTYCHPCTPTYYVSSQSPTVVCPRNYRWPEKNHWQSQLIIFWNYSKPFFVKYSFQIWSIFEKYFEKFFVERTSRFHPWVLSQDFCYPLQFIPPDILTINANKRPVINVKNVIEKSSFSPSLFTWELPFWPFSSSMQPATIQWNE